MPRDLTPDELSDLRALLASGGEIEALKRYRSLTGVGLAEAKVFVDALLLPAQEPASLPPELLDLCVARRCQSGDRSALDAQLRRAEAQYGAAAGQAAALAAERLVLAACRLVEDCRSGQLAQAALAGQLAARQPGFSPASYQRAIEYGFFASR